MKNGINNITILGSGTCVPSLKRSSCSVLLRDQTHTFLLDAGPGTMRRLLQAGVAINEVDVILLSHFHPDHCAEIPPFLFATKYPGFKRKKKLTIMGGTGVKKLLDKMNSTFGRTMALSEEFFEIKELLEGDNTPAKIGTITIDHAKVEHKNESRAYRFTDSKGFSIVYSGDTDYSENLIELSKNADILICESALPDNEKVKGHLVPSLAGEIASKAKVKKLVLTHFYPECDSIDIKKQCEQKYQGSVILAKDLLTWEKYFPGELISFHLL